MSTNMHHAPTWAADFLKYDTTKLAYERENIMVGGLEDSVLTLPPLIYVSC